MKPVLQFATYIILITAVTFISCKKEKPVSYSFTPPPPPPPSPDTLRGKEFLFNDLTWVYSDQDEEIFIGVWGRHDLFNNSSRQMEVSIKFDTAAVWMNIPQWNGPALPANNGYLYFIYDYFSDFYVLSYPLNFQLIGRRASLKIKFL